MDMAQVVKSESLMIPDTVSKAILFSMIAPIMSCSSDSEKVQRSLVRTHFVLKFDLDLLERLLGQFPVDRPFVQVFVRLCNWIVKGSSI